MLRFFFKNSEEEQEVTGDVKFSGKLEISDAETSNEPVSLRQLEEATLELGETSTTAYRGDRGKTAYDHSQETGNPHETGIGDIENLTTELADRYTKSDVNDLLEGKVDVVVGSRLINSAEVTKLGTIEEGAQVNPTDVSELNNDANYLVGNAAITPGTATKVTYDAKGLVTAGGSLSESDIPNLPVSKITSGTNTAFNKNFGTAADTVAEGDHTHTLQEIIEEGNTVSDNNIAFVETIDSISQSVLDGYGLNVAGESTTHYGEAVTHGDPEGDNTVLRFSTPTNSNDILIPSKSGVIALLDDFPETQSRNYLETASVGTSGQSLASYGIVVNADDVYKVVFAGSATMSVSGSIAIRNSSTTIISSAIPAGGLTGFEGALEMYVVDGFIHFMHQLRIGANFSIQTQQTAISAGSTINVNLFATTDINGGVVLRKRHIERATRYDI